MLIDMCMNNNIAYTTHKMYEYNFRMFFLSRPMIVKQYLIALLYLTDDQFDETTYQRYDKNSQGNRIVILPLAMIITHPAAKMNI